MHGADVVRAEHRLYGSTKYRALEITGVGTDNQEGSVRKTAEAQGEGGTGDLELGGGFQDGRGDTVNAEGLEDVEETETCAQIDNLVELLLGVDPDHPKQYARREDGAALGRSEFECEEQQSARLGDDDDADATLDCPDVDNLLSALLDVQPSQVAEDESDQGSEEESHQGATAEDQGASSPPMSGEKESEEELARALARASSVVECVELLLEAGVEPVPGPSSRCP
eukprot:3303149-Rhodomonas_salina.1